MTRRRADSFVQVHCPDGRKFMLENPGQQLLDAVLAAIGILPRLRKPEQRREPLTPGQAADRSARPIQ